MVISPDDNILKTMKCKMTVQCAKPVVGFLHTNISARGFGHSVVCSTAHPVSFQLLTVHSKVKAECIESTYTHTQLKYLQGVSTLKI